MQWNTCDMFSLLCRITLDYYSTEYRPRYLCLFGTIEITFPISWSHNSFTIFILITCIVRMVGIDHINVVFTTHLL